MEPISTYSTQSKFGRQLYDRQAEKKYVAQYLVASRAPDGSTLIQEDDCIIITEGTSGFYVGLGIAEGLTDTEIITSNGSLLREYRDNPAIARRFRKIRSVGGEVDYDSDLNRSEHDGVHGALCNQLETALTEHPPATAVVVTCSYLFADAGPINVGPTASLKAEIVRKALESDVRKIVFVADHTKHTRKGSHGNQLFGQHEWRELVEKNLAKIHIVTSPPPALRAALTLGKGLDVRRRKSLEDIEHPPVPFTDDDRLYNTEAFALQALVGGDLKKSKFYSHFSEAYDDILPTFPTVLRFLIDSDTGFTEEHFRKELSTYFGIDELPFDIRVRHNGSNQLSVSVIGRGLSGRLLRRLKFDQQSQQLRHFELRTSTRRTWANVPATPQAAIS